MGLDEYSLLTSEIAQRLRAKRPNSPPIIISVDGLGGVGKSTLGKKLAEQSGAVHFELDDYLTHHQGTYLQYLDYDQIEEDLNLAEAQFPPAIIVDGLCVLAVCERIRREPDIKIYLRRVDASGTWEDEYWYSEDNDLHETLRMLDRQEERYSDMPGIADSDREFARYHVEMRPISNADFVLDIPKRHPINKPPA